MIRRASRIVKTSLASRAFDGEGARQFGGRWNSAGTSMVYTSENVALAALEILVHVQSSPLLLSYCVVSVEFDDSLIEKLDPAELPPDWRRSPPPSALRSLGDRWVHEGRSTVLQVPSALVPTESNFLFNPRHEGFQRVVIGEAVGFELDGRFR